MITLLSRKLGSKRKTQRKTMASKIVPNGLAGSTEKQVEQPEIDSDALNRRASEVTKEIQRESVVDKEKVSRIKAEIENGTYKVDADSIAEKLMEFDFQIDDKSQE